jgi:hypothetical protein
MNTTILIQVKEVYGTGLVYVVSEHQNAIQQLTGRKTLTPNDIQNLKALGFEIKVKVTHMIFPSQN